MRVTSRNLGLAGRRWIGWCFLAAMPLGAAAQPAAQSGSAVQREAMQKLAFIAGRWSGPVTITQGPGEPLKLTQTEDVQYKLDRLVLLVEGKSTDASGKTMFSALAVISYDDATEAYRIRAYHDGRYVDAELKVSPDGFSWGFPAGPAQVMNTMHLTGKGEWQETTEVSFGSNPPQRSVEMLLTHQ
jgi:hypothetical protein